MTGAQFRAELARLELSQLGAARLFGVDGRTVRKWVADESSIPWAIVILLRLLRKRRRKGRITVADIEEVNR